jgi:transposase
VTALAAAGYAVFAVSPLQAARYRERHGVSGAKSDAADAHMLADMVRTGAYQLRQVAADSPGAQAVKVVVRAHKTLIWERSRQVHRLRYQLRDFFPAALEAYDSLGLDAADVLELLAKAPDPASAAKLTTAQVSAVLKRGRRHHVSDKTAVIRESLRSAQLSQPSQVTAAGAAVVRGLAAVITTLSQQIKVLEGQVEAHFLQHPDAEITLSQPGLGPVLGARVLAEFGDDPVRYASAKARKNHAATNPITRCPGRSRPSSPGTCITTGSATSWDGRPTRPSPPRRARRPLAQARHRSDRAHPNASGARKPLLVRARLSLPAATRRSRRCRDGRKRPAGPWR